MAVFSLKTELSRGSRIRGMIAREVSRGARSSTLRLMRMKALLLKVEERLQGILLQRLPTPVPLRVPVDRRRR